MEYSDEDKCSECGKTVPAGVMLVVVVVSLFWFVVGIGAGLSINTQSSFHKGYVTSTLDMLGGRK